MEGIKSILFDYLKQQREVIIYGCGQNGRFLQWYFSENDVKINFWCDGNKVLWNGKINNIRCISPKELREHQCAVVIVSILNYTEVLRQLEGYRFQKIFTWDDVKFLRTELHYEQELLRKYRKWRLEQIPDLAVKLKKNERFRNIHKGQRCFIIGNGPSVREQDLSLLHNEITFTVNQIARNSQFQAINTNYHLWADPNFFKTELICDGDYELLRIMKQLPESTECFFPYDSANEYIEKFELEKYINVNYYSSSEFVNEEEEINFMDFIRGGYTVVQYAIRLAIYMGFTEIYLLGCECTTILNVINVRTSRYTAVTHCYDIDEEEKERAKNMYFSLPMQAYYESERGLLEEYHILREYCRKKDVKLMNCTPGGLLEEIPRISYEAVIDKI